MARTPRYRLRYTFWLNHLNKDEEIVADTIERLKTERSFATVVRDGIMIVAELRQGRVDLLLRLYPWIVDKILTTYAPPTPPPAPSGGDLERLIEASVQTSVTAAMLNMPTIPAPPANYPAMKESRNTIGKDVQFTAAPDEDDPDDGDTIVLKPSTNKTSPLENLLAGMMQADERSERLYAERLAAGDIDPRSGRSISARMD